jgi:hypothetical protein
MFEVRSEANATATKHQHENFLTELDRGRSGKGCEYVALAWLRDERELVVVKAQNIDVTGFERNLETLKGWFSRSFGSRLSGSVRRSRGSPRPRRRCSGPRTICGSPTRRPRV